MTSANLEKVLAALETAERNLPLSRYLLPRIWQEPATGVFETGPATWHRKTLETILGSPSATPARSFSGQKNWTEKSVVYNLFVRLTTAFDHDGDGTVSPDPLSCGFRETGTFLKSIALLPYIERLGANTIYLLPVTEPGKANRKGNLGSPYAVKNPSAIDPLLSEPALGLDPETEFGAFIEAAHRLGMRVVQEFVFRTTSVDSDWIARHPDWYYWLRTEPGSDSAPQSYGPPEFDAGTLATIYEKVDKHDLSNLPEPPETYRKQFTGPPATVSLTTAGYAGTAPDGSGCIVASAFSDWPPDDRQPPWTDVAYLKMHRHERFNYVAYNTIRMYDTALDRPEHSNRELWESVSNIIPLFQERFGIDGAMIDMGHALPRDLKSTVVENARRNDPDFSFWDENFDPSPPDDAEGVDAVFGSLPFVIQDPIYIRGLLNYLNRTGVKVPFFGTGENHNTPRLCHNLAGRESGRNRSRFIFGLACVLPAIPFIHSGMEICESTPVNLGLNFTERDRETWGPETLPLFSARSYEWRTCNGLEPLGEFMAAILSVRARYLDVIMNGTAGSITVPYISSPDMLAVMRKGERCSLLFAGNSNSEKSARGFMEFQQKSFTLTDMVSGTLHTVEGNRLELEMAPGQCMLFELPGQAETLETVDNNQTK